jgi:hypothetical protein
MAPAFLPPQAWAKLVTAVGEFLTVLAVKGVEGGLRVDEIAKLLSVHRLDAASFATVFGESPDPRRSK